MNAAKWWLVLNSRDRTTVRHSRRCPCRQEGRRISLVNRFLLLTFLVASWSLGLGAETAPRIGAVAGPPPELHPTELHEKVRSYFSAVNRSPTPLFSVLGDTLLYEALFDIRWQIGRAINAREDLRGLAEFGLAAHPDGSYSIDLARNPDWEFPEDRLWAMFRPGMAELTLEHLSEKGMSEDGVQGLRNWLAQNDRQRQVLVATRRGADKFAATVHSRTAAKQKMPAAEIDGFVYENTRSVRRATRKWASALFDALNSDEQILIHSLAQQVGGEMAIFPTDPELDRRSLEESVASGTFLAAYETVTTEAVR